MHDDDLTRDLDVLLRHASSRAQLASAADVRRLADVRRTRRRIAGAAAGAAAAVLAVGLIMALPSDDGTAPDLAPPVPDETQPLVDPVTDADVFDGTREVALLPVDTDSAVRAGADGSTSLTRVFDEEARFVLVPTGEAEGTYLVKTGRVRVGGEASCLAAGTGTGDPQGVAGVACDVSDAAQVWRFEPTGRSDGRPTYRIVNGDELALIVDDDAQVLLARAGRSLPFLLPDQGPQQLPSLD